MMHFGELQKVKPSKPSKKEIEDNVVDRNPKDQENAVQIRNGNFAWEKQTEKANAIIRDINLAIPKGHLTAVVGKVGSGKSSLLLSILGEMEHLSGYVAVNGSIAYVTQQAWIQNMSLKDNILFGRPFNDTLYDKVLDVCSLKTDIKNLPDGDATEIGEKGINLSGGQKQRVSLARAVYHNADIYLFDDPLSAVDAHVGKHIFEKVLSNDGILKHKTRILVTHALHNLKNMDKIFVMTDGQITESGTYRELLDKRGAFSNILLTYLQEKVEEDLTEDSEEIEENLDEREGKEVEDAINELKTIDPGLDRQLSAISETVLTKRRSSMREKSLSPRSKKDKSKARLTQDETTETGRVKTDVYRAYFSAMGYPALAGCLLLTVISNAFIAGANFWLSKWSNDVDMFGQNRSNGSNTIHGDEFYLTVYVSLGLAQGLFVLLSAVLLAFATMSASRILHLTLVHRIFRAPLSFFDVTPLGRVINRCGKDVDVVDSALSTTIRSWIYCVCSVLTTLTVITITILYFGLVVVPLAIMYYFVLRFYVSTSRQLKRLESVSRSPIFSHFQESISGVSSIRAYEVQNRFIDHSYRLMDINQACYYCTLVSNRWLAIRLEFIGNLMVFFAAMFAVLMRNQLFGGEVGLAISYALAVTQTLNWAVRMTSDLETNIVSVERIKEYSEIQTEAKWISNVRPVKEWPQNGTFTFENLCLRYKRDLDLVLKHLSLTIEGGQKIGIVGRTGAGKSSLTLALFRILEASEGKVLLDDIDIKQIGLHDLRSKLTIIPQDPILFSSTFRFNLDPFERHSDEEIWTALEQAHLKSFIASQPQKLNFMIQEGGENLSVGQRQLVCLARALLRKTKVLILDEATAAVDLETDDLVQKSIRKYFSDCTILTIAHRINTIMDSDKLVLASGILFIIYYQAEIPVMIMVLSDGRIVEYDSPTNLLENKDSLFYALAVDAGVA
uniref:ABC-type glutathione-S-conjugate transporter n=1 Tax=Romanomermis culicivorax TaxID=13658 RepID=A0A915IZK5_ROMCU